jgi:hypothetical protein
VAVLQQAMLAIRAAPSGGNDAFTKLLLHFGGTSNSKVFTDSSASAKVPSSVVGCYIFTGGSKFGGTCTASDGIDGWHVDYSAEADFAFGTGDWTIDFWYNHSSGSNPIFVDFRPTGTNGAYPAIYLSAGNVITYFVNNANVILGPALQFGWTHIAVARAGTSTKLFVNGVQGGATYVDNNNYLVGASRPRLFGNGTNGSNVVNGYTDELRISKGIARWTANFTPPTVAYF